MDLKKHSFLLTASLMALGVVGTSLVRADDDTPIPIKEPKIEKASNEGQLAIQKMKLPPGFKAELFAAEPMVASPVAICTDNLGRVYVVETDRIENGIFDVRSHMDWLEDDLASKTVEDRIAMLHRKLGPNFRRETQGHSDRLVRLEDSTGSGKADKSVIFADGFNHSDEGIAAGVLVRGKDVYFADIPNLWLLRDTKGTGVADFKKSLSYGYGIHYCFFGHDLHGLRFGPDGKLYFSIGDRAANVTQSVDGTTLANTESGAVFRCNADGSHLELYAMGLRNPQSLAFDQYGNLFTGDNNPDYGDPARMVYVIQGGDNGWRVGYQESRQPVGGGPWMWEHLWEMEDKLDAYSQLPAIGFPGAGPAGMAYYPGTGFPPEYQNHLFLCDFHGAFTGSGIQAFVANPSGASFRIGPIEKFCWDTLATDLCFMPEGGIDVSDWVQGWNCNGKGRIYHVFDPKYQNDPAVLEVKKLLAEGMTSRSTEELIKLLGHVDMRIRQEAQFELAARGDASISAITETATNTHNQRLPRIHAIWALGQIADADQSAQPLAAVVPLTADTDDEVRAQAEKTLGSERDGDAYDGTTKLLTDANPRVRFFAAVAAGRLGRKEISPQLIELLRTNADKDAFIRYAAVQSLAQLNDASVIATAAGDSSRSVRMGALLVYRRLGSPKVADFLNDKDPAIVLEAARAIHDTYIESARPALAAMISRTGLDERVIARVLNSNYRLGTPTNATALAQFAASDAQPEKWRVEALELLGLWQNPSNLDRIMNLYRPLSPRDIAVARDAAGAVLPGIFKVAPDAVKVAGMKLIGELQIKSGALAYEMASDPRLTPTLRAAALNLLAEQSDPKLSSAVSICLEDKDIKLRAAAIRCLALLPDGPARLAAAMKGASIPEQQAIYDALAKVHTSGADDMISSAMDQILAGTLPRSLWLEVLQAAKARASGAVHEKYAKYEEIEKANSEKDTLAYVQECLEGGDAEAGEKIFRERADVSCIRCHTAHGQGGTVGPVLDGIGARQTRQYMLESIVDPNAKIAPGFESAIIKTKDGKTEVGIVHQETADRVVLTDNQGKLHEILKSNIVSRQTGLSAMPQEIARALSRRDLRDLVEFLASLKTVPEKPKDQPPQSTPADASNGNAEVGK